jgi:hypothetical protein
MATAEVEQIEQALDVLLKACLKAEKSDRRIRPPNDPSGLGDRVDFTKTWAKAEAAADHILVRPLALATAWPFVCLASGSTRSAATSSCRMFGNG